MFSGLIDGTGRLVRALPSLSGIHAHIRTACRPFGGHCDTVAVAGVAVDILKQTAEEIVVFLPNQQLALSTLGCATPGCTANLEFAGRSTRNAPTRPVAGRPHSIASVVGLRARGREQLWSFALEAEDAVPHPDTACVYVDGLRARVVELGNRTFTVVLPTLTVVHSSFADRGLGSRVNVEFPRGVLIHEYPQPSG